MLEQVHRLLMQSLVVAPNTTADGAVVASTFGRSITHDAIARFSCSNWPTAQTLI